MDTEKNIKQLVQELTKENEELKDKNAMLIDELAIYQQNYGNNWLEFKEYKAAIEEAKKAKKAYDKANKEIALLRAKYETKLNEMLEQYKFKK